MVELRISKYSPALRDPDGIYTRDEWTSVADVGNEFGNSIVTLDDYLSVENQYVSVVLQLMQAAGVTELYITDLRIHADFCSNLPTALQEECRDDLNLIRNAHALDFELVSKAVRLELREIIGGRLIGPRDFYVHFGYDYYMFAGYSGEMDEIRDVSTPLYLEPFVSPCRPEETVIVLNMDEDADVARIYLADIPSDGMAKALVCKNDAGNATFELNFDKGGHLIYIKVSPAHIGLPVELLRNSDIIG